MRWIDLPPVWLALALAVAYLVGELIPVSLGTVGYWIGTGLFWMGLLLIGAAAIEFLRARTSIIPRDQPKALITSGIFSITRNPIYLADALILAGLCLRWDAALALLLVPVFVVFIDRRFVRQEEQFLDIAFPEAFADYVSRTRRWI